MRRLKVFVSGIIIRAVLEGDEIGNLADAPLKIGY